MNKLIVAAIIVVLVSVLAWLGHRSQGAFAHESLVDKLRQYEGGALMPDHQFDTADFMRVHADMEDLRSFFVPVRSTAIASFPCQNCHSIPLTEMGTAGQREKKRAHWDVQVMHAGATVMDCFTCHSKTHLDQLESLGGHPISFDRSFELCAQCHTTQYKDWLGGAHGKNLSGWLPPRVAQTCVGCHDPHKPAIESRWPSRWTGK
jgi:hypothetical protein